MKRLLLPVITVLFITGANAQWTTNGPSATDVACFAFSGSSIFAAATGNNGGVYMSTDSGNSWTTANTGLPQGGGVVSLVVSSAGIFASIQDGGPLFLSTNNGASWAATASTGLPSGGPPLAINGSTLFAATAGNGVYVSSDNANTWTLVAGLPNTLSATSFLFTGSEIFVSSVGNIFLSTDNGVSWTNVNGNLSGDDKAVNCLAANSAGIFASAITGVFLSTDNGGSWSPVNTGLPTNNNAPKLLSTNQGLFTGDFSGNLYFSANNGGNWVLQNYGLPGTGILAFGCNGTTVFAGTNGNGVYQQSLSAINSVSPAIISSGMSQFKLYPNPANNNFIIQTANPVSQQLQLFDLTGQLLLSQSITNSKTTIDANGLAAGVYLVSLKSREGVSTERIVIAK